MRVSYSFFKPGDERRENRLGHSIDVVQAMTGMTKNEIICEVAAGRLVAISRMAGRGERLCITFESVATWLDENDVRRPDLNSVQDKERLTVNHLVRFSGKTRDQIQRMIDKGEIPVLSRPVSSRGGKYWFRAGDLKKSSFIDHCPETTRPPKQQPLISKEPVQESQEQTKCHCATLDLSTVDGILAEFGRNDVRIILDGDSSAFIYGKRDVVERLRPAFDEKRDDILKCIFSINQPEKAAIGITIAYLNGLKESLEKYYIKVSYAEGEIDRLNQQIVRLKREIVRLKEMQDRASSSPESKEVSRVPAPEATGCASKSSPALPAGGLRAVFRRFCRVREAV